MYTYMKHLMGTSFLESRSKERAAGCCYIFFRCSAPCTGCPSFCVLRSHFQWVAYGPGSSVPTP